MPWRTSLGVKKLHAGGGACPSGSGSCPLVVGRVCLNFACTG